MFTPGGAWCSLLTTVGVMVLTSTASADNLKLNRHFNEYGNLLIADQFNNRVIEIDPVRDDRLVVRTCGPNDFSANSRSIIGVNDAQRVGVTTR
jgi:hypothetical protein